ncbi:hypothetical protein [Butyrivibrio sp. XPD2002]|nr:hypothetical protein [Butyrivibrio sp. XPD2002]
MATRKRKRLSKDIKEYIHDDECAQGVFLRSYINVKEDLHNSIDLILKVL